MNRHLMMLGAMSARIGAIAASSAAVIVDDPHDSTPRKAKAIASPRQERKEKSTSLKRMLGRKGRA